MSETNARKGMAKLVADNARGYRYATEVQVVPVVEV